MLLTVLSACTIIDPDDRLVPVTDTPSRPALLVEFTGINCVNCPTAEATAAELLSSFPQDHLVVVAMHPATNPFTQATAPYDYTCPEADEYYLHCGGTVQTPFPTGTINLAPAQDGSYFVDYPLWATALTQSRPWPIVTAYSVQVNNALEISAVSLSLAPQDVSVITWLVEDSVQGAQRMEDGSLTLDYYHRHVLRQALSPVWGDSVTLDPLGGEVLRYAIPVTDRKHYSCVTLIWQDNEVKYVTQLELQ